jgi:hypothetical protein
MRRTEGKEKTKGNRQERRCNKKKTKKTGRDNEHEEREKKRRTKGKRGVVRRTGRADGEITRNETVAE